MDGRRIPKDMLYGELAQGSRGRGRPLLRYKDACKRDMKHCNINVDSWEEGAKDRTAWRQSVRNGIKEADDIRFQRTAEKRERRKQSVSTEPSGFVCPDCSRDCHSRIGLHSHRKSSHRK